MTPDLRSSIAAALARISAIPRWRLTPVVLALLLLVMPVRSWRTRAVGPLSIVEVEILALVGIAAGWVFFDRLRRTRIPAVGAWLGLLALAGGGWVAWLAVAGLGRGLVRGPETVLAVSFLFGGLIRGPELARSVASLVPIAAVTTWLTFDLWQIPHLPLRDLHLYLGAGATALAGGSPYLTAPITSTANKQGLPFVYPPFTIPLFELLASVPRFFADVLWVGSSIAAVAAALWLLGVRGRWLLVLVAWPPLAQGVMVGNVASFTFFLLALGYRLGSSIVLSGVFKVQSMIPSLWLVRERRWRSIGIAVMILGALAAISLPIVGLHVWLSWPDGLRHFQESLARFPSLESRSLVRWPGPLPALLLSALAVVLALGARGRNGLARFSLASIVASPTLYLHGLSPLLPGMLILGPELLWFALGLGPWRAGFHLQAAWAAMALVGLALLRAGDSDLRIPADLGAARADLHPLSRVGQVWPA